MWHTYDQKDTPRGNNKIKHAFVNFHSDPTVSDEKFRGRIQTSSVLLIFISPPHNFFCQGTQEHSEEEQQKCH